MLRLRSVLVLPFLLLAPLAAVAQDLPAEQAALRETVTVLSDDAMAGRESTSPGYRAASNYVAQQFEAAGLSPAGDDGTWFQRVPLATYAMATPGTLRMTRNGQVVGMRFGTDFMNIANPNRQSFRQSGEVVFAGWGIVDGETGRDDYAGLDVRGKIVAVLDGVPPGLSPAVNAHMSDAEAKAGIAAAHGAVGVLLIETVADNARFPMARMAPFWNRARTTWADRSGVAHVDVPTARPLARISMEGARRMFDGSPLSWDGVVAAQSGTGAMPRGPLGMTVDAFVKTNVNLADSRNVVGMLRGSDPALAEQYVVLSAHLDHVGIGRPDQSGDTIYNGAMDNAIGVATILQVARKFEQSGTRPRRSILFLALAAEEKGLLGSSYYAANPTVSGTLVANVNMDMPIMTYPIEDLVVLGGERSSIGPMAEQAAASVGLRVVPDPMPEEMFFVRTDHYSFVQAGIPSVSIDTGPGGAGEAAIRDFLAHHYHRASDEVTLPFNWESAARYTDANYALVRALADADARPRWNMGDFFGVAFHGYGATAQPAGQ